MASETETQDLVGETKADETKSEPAPTPRNDGGTGASTGSSGSSGIRAFFEDPKKKKYCIIGSIVGVCLFILIVGLAAGLSKKKSSERGPDFFVLKKNVKTVPVLQDPTSDFMQCDGGTSILMKPYALGNLTVGDLLVTEFAGGATSKITKITTLDTFLLLAVTPVSPLEAFEALQITVNISQGPPSMDRSVADVGPPIDSVPYILTSADPFTTDIVEVPDTATVMRFAFTSTNNATILLTSDASSIFSLLYPGSVLVANYSAFIDKVLEWRQLAVGMPFALTVVATPDDLDNSSFVTWGQEYSSCVSNNATTGGTILKQTTTVPVGSLVPGRISVPLLMNITSVSILNNMRVVSGRIGFSLEDIKDDVFSATADFTASFNLGYSKNFPLSWTYTAPPVAGFPSQSVTYDAGNITVDYNLGVQMQVTIEQDSDDKLQRVGASITASHGGYLGFKFTLSGSFQYDSPHYPLPFKREFQPFRAFQIGIVTFYCSPVLTYSWGFNIGANVQLDLTSRVGFQGSATIGADWYRSTGIKGTAEVKNELVVDPPQFDLSCNAKLVVSLYQMNTFYFAPTILGVGKNIKAFALGIEIPFEIAINGTVPGNGCSACNPVGLQISGGIGGPSELNAVVPLICDPKCANTKPGLKLEVKGEFSTCLAVPQAAIYLPILCGANPC